MFGVSELGRSSFSNGAWRGTSKHSILLDRTKLRAYRSVSQTECENGVILTDTTRRAFLGSSAALLGIPITQFDSRAGEPGLDQTDLLSEAVQWCKARRKNLILTEGQYLTTRSIDGTADSSAQQFQILGPGPYICSIVHDLVEDFPVLDMSGNGKGSVQGFSILPGNNSKATCGILVAKGRSSSTTGNGFMIDNMYIAAGSQPNHAAVAVYNSDLSRISNTTIGRAGGGAGLTIGMCIPNGIQSKFGPMSSELDLTQVYVFQSQIGGDKAPALEFTGGAAISLRDIYAATCGEGSEHIVKISAANRHSGNSFWADVLRTENQSKATHVGAVHFSARSICGRIVGNLQTDLDGYAIGSDAGCTVERYQLQVNSYARLFRMMGGLASSEISSAAHPFGNISTGNTSSLNFVGVQDFSEILSQLNDCPGIHITDSTGTHISSGRILPHK